MKRQGFTLVEMLVVIAILTILVSITAASMKWTAQKDRVPQAANEVSSFIMGARDRAIYARKPVGVRLILDRNGPVNQMGNPATVSSMMYVGSPEPFTGTCSLDWNPADPTNHRKRIQFWWSGPDLDVGDTGVDDDMDGTPDNTTAELGMGDDVEQTASRTQWDTYFQFGLIGTGAKFKLSKGGSLPLTYTIVQAGTPLNPEWLLTSDFPPNNITGCLDLDFELELFPAALPNQEPKEFPKGVCVDLEASLRKGVIPSAWHDPGTRRYLTMDIMFSPRGTGTGDWSGFGLCNLVIAEQADVEKTEYPVPAEDFYRLQYRPKAGQERCVSVNPTTGRASVSAILLDDSDANDVPDDPFQFAETGQVTK